MGKNTVVIYITSKRIGLRSARSPLKCSNPRCKNLVSFKKGDFAISKVSSGFRKLYCEECTIELAMLTEKEITIQKAHLKCLLEASK